MNPLCSRPPSNDRCLEDILSELKLKLGQAVKRVEQEADKCREAGRRTLVDTVTVENRFDELERELTAEFQNIHRFLFEEEQKEVERLRRERRKQLKKLKVREKKISEQSGDLERAVTVLSSKLSEEEKQEEESPKLLREIQDLIRRSNVTFVPPAEVDTEVRSSHFLGPVQYRMWKHMKSCLYPNITPVTFDPETAHPQLSLSPSGATVWFDETRDPQGCQENPRRFHYYYCLLGRSSFTTGRHYWEVQVGSKTAWRLGVAREDVFRGEMKATGTSAGLWTLALKGEDVLACTDPEPTRVHVSVRLDCVGVFLDCEKEEVSFFDAVTMAPVYTFTTGTLLVPLLPFFNPCDTDEGKNSEPIHIFSPNI